MSERISVTFLGTTLGTCDGWDQCDTLSHMFYDFEPANGWREFFKNTNGDLFLDFKGGTWAISKEVEPAEFPDKPSQITTTSGKLSLAKP